MTTNRWRNVRNQHIYVVEDDCVTDASNDGQGKRMVLYRREESGPRTLYVREYYEFLEKFVRMDQACPGCGETIHEMLYATHVEIENVAAYVTKTATDIDQAVVTVMKMMRGRCNPTEAVSILKRIYGVKAS